MIEFFLNEMSINQQYDNDHEFRMGLRSLIQLIQALSIVKAEQRLTLRSVTLFDYTPLQETRFDTVLKQNNDLNRLFIENLNRLNIKGWQPNRIHLNSDTYTVLDTRCTDTSVAEVAERIRSFTGYRGLLLNFIKSQFGNNTRVNVIKNSDQTSPITVACSYDQASLRDWLTEVGYVIAGSRSFEHHKQKHDRARPTPGNSVLECTNQEAQVLLDEAISESDANERLYNFDTARHKYIIFNKHNPNAYHGYHINDETLIPSSVKKRLGQEP